MRDELTELMLELPAEQRHTPAQIFHIYESTVARLNMPFPSFQAKNLLTLEHKRAASTTKPTAKPSPRCSRTSISKTNNGRCPTRPRPRPTRLPPSPPPAAAQQVQEALAALQQQYAASAAECTTRQTRAGRTPTLPTRRPGHRRRRIRRLAGASPKRKRAPAVPTAAATPVCRRAQREAPHQPPLPGQNPPRERTQPSPTQQPSTTTQSKTASATRRWRTNRPQRLRRTLRMRLTSPSTRVR